MAALLLHAFPASPRIEDRAAEHRDAAAAHNPAAAAILLKDRPGAGELKYLLLPAIESGRPVIIDASAVEKLPMPALQVILSAAATLQARSTGLIIRNATFTFTQAFEALGFAGNLRLGMGNGGLKSGSLESGDLARNRMD
eukprot:gene8139-10877_t